MDAGFREKNDTYLFYFWTLEVKKRCTIRYTVPLGLTHIDL